MELLLVGERPLTQAAFLSGEGPDRLVIDATKLTFASPLDLAGIVSAAHWAASDAIPVTFRLPTDLNMASYLQRMDVLRQMPSRTSILGHIPPDARNDHRRRLVEVTALNAGNMDDLAEKLGPFVTSFYESHSQAAGASVFKACSELMGNAAEHGASEEGAFLAAQVYTGKTTKGPRLEFAVCDTGIGVMNHLRQNPEHAHFTRDELAIAKAIQAGVSGMSTAGRGNGLSDAVRDAQSDGRIDLTIRSGKGEVKVIRVESGEPVATNHDRPDQTSGNWAWLTHQSPS